jgi:hypothetical protein
MKCDIRKFAFPMDIVMESYVDIVDTNTMMFINSNDAVGLREWIIPDISASLAIAYRTNAVEVFDSDRDDLCYPGFKLARGCGHNAIYPHRYYRESE